MSDSLLDVFFAMWCVVVVATIFVWWATTPVRKPKIPSPDDGQLELALRLERAEKEIHSARKLVRTSK
jgi:hypothetical protein